MKFDGELQDQHKEEMKKHGNFNQENIAEHYDELSSHYEEIYLRAGWHDPKMCAAAAMETLKNPMAHVLDMGCGTGLVGDYMKAEGYNHVVGVDASPGMLEKAASKGSYKELHELFLGRP